MRSARPAPSMSRRGFYTGRPIMPLISFLGVKSTRVEPLMTYDAHVFFASTGDARAGIAILESAKIDGKRLFHVEPDEHDPSKIFYRVEMHDPVQSDAEFVFRNEAARFSDHFTTIVQRTGKHQQSADLFANFAIGRDDIPNHELSDLLERSAIKKMAV